MTDDNPDDSNKTLEGSTCNKFSRHTKNPRKYMNLYSGLDVNTIYYPPNIDLRDSSPESDILWDVPNGQNEERPQQRECRRGLLEFRTLDAML